MKDYVTYAPMVMWCFNYDYEFIDNVWWEDPYITRHLQNKWDEYLSNSRSTAEAMLKFYANLDGENQRLLDAYIHRKYKHYHEYTGEIIASTTTT